MIYANYFKDENGNVAKVTGISAIEPEFESNDKSELYRISFLYPEGTTAECDMLDNNDGTYALYRDSKKKFLPAVIINGVIYFSDYKHIPEQPKTVSISPEKMGDFIKCLEVLAQVMKITIVSARNLFETNEIK